MPHAALMMLPSTQVLGRLPSRPLPLDGTNLRLDGCHDPIGDLILNGENVLQRSIVSFGPNMDAGFSVDELRGDTHARPGIANASLQHVSDAQLARHLLYVHSLVFVSEGRAPGG